MLFDAALHPWLLEVNLAPSLDTSASALLGPLKERVLRDTIRLAVTRPAAPEAGLPPTPGPPETTAFEVARRYWVECETRRELANLGGYEPLFTKPSRWAAVAPLVEDPHGYAHELYASGALRPG